jgi:hypothetical protein
MILRYFLDRLARMVEGLGVKCDGKCESLGRMTGSCQTEYGYLVKAGISELTALETTRGFTRRFAK